MPSGTGSTSGWSTWTRLPRQPWHLRAFAHFSSADHLGDPGLPIKGNIENYLALNGIDLGDRGRVLMLANARVLGHVFDPLSVFWCYDSAGGSRASSRRSTTPTASGTPTSCGRTRRGPP